jgi:hypothetical protein
MSFGEVDFLASSLGPEWLELPIFDRRLPRRGGLMNIRRTCHTTFSIVIQQSAIDNENLVLGLRLRAALCTTRYKSLNDSSLSGNELFDLGTGNLKTGQSALLRFLWCSVENVWIQFLGAGLQMARELQQVRREATGSG